MKCHVISLQNIYFYIPSFLLPSVKYFNIATVLIFLIHSHVCLRTEVLHARFDTLLLYAVALNPPALY